MGLPAWEWRAMGTTWRIYHGGRAFQHHADAVVALVEADEQRWSRFRGTSELSHINGRAGMPVKVSTETIELLAACDRWRDETDGVFAPLVGRAMESWGYATSRDEAPLGRIESPEHVDVPRDGLVFDEDLRLARVPPGALLDLGGIAKMWSAQRAADLLRARCEDRSLLLEAGGDLIAVRGAHEVAVEAPGDRVVALKEGMGVATSGWSRRHWRNGDGTDAHHLIDPATGRPGPRVQATVVAAEPVEAEIRAKVLSLRPELLSQTIQAALVCYDERVQTSEAWIEASAA